MVCFYYCSLCLFYFYSTLLIAQFRQQFYNYEDSNIIHSKYYIFIGKYVVWKYM